MRGEGKTRFKRGKESEKQLYKTETDGSSSVMGNEAQIG